MVHWRQRQAYTDTQADLTEVLRDYSNANGYQTQHYAEAGCVCGNRTFQLAVNDDAGVAVRKCSLCGLIRAIADSDEYLPEANLEECECPCGASDFQITVGVSLYTDSEDVKWLYIGCRCPSCGLSGCYGDWKNEYNDYRQLLAMV